MMEALKFAMQLPVKSLHFVFGKKVPTNFNDGIVLLEST